MLKRYVLHIEWHRGYRPRISLRPMIKHGQRGTDGGQTGHFINCQTCSGEGTLFVPDEMPPLRNLAESLFIEPYDPNKVERDYERETREYKLSPETLELGYDLGTRNYKPGEIVWTQHAEYVVDGIRDKTLYLIRKDVWEARNRFDEPIQTAVQICKCRNLADEAMPPSERIGDQEAKRLGLWLTRDCPIHRPNNSI